jgi:ActR/RegA family two-component response regulator
MENRPKTTLAMHALLLCSDVQFLGTTRGILNQLRVTPKIAGGCDTAQVLIQTQEFDVIIVDWREIESLGDFLSAVRRSKRNQDCVLVAIVRDLLDLRQAFAAGVHFLIHKPASVVQIERCLRAAYCATVARRRKQHREPVSLDAVIRTRIQVFGEAMVVNLSESGAGLRMSSEYDGSGAFLSAGDEVELRFALPETDSQVQVTGTVMWTTASHCGVRFAYVPDAGRVALERWLTECVERSLAELCDRLRAVCA